jgi:hypothetical protein
VTAKQKPDVKTLAGTLFRDGFPENYDDIIREMSDDEFELLWELFNQERQVGRNAVKVLGTSEDLNGKIPTLACFRHSELGSSAILMQLRVRLPRGHQDGGMSRRNPLGSVRPCGPAGLPPTCNKARHHERGPSVAFFPDLLIQKRCVVAALIPVLFEVGSKRIHLRRWPMRWLSFRNSPPRRQRRMVGE